MKRKSNRYFIVSYTANSFNGFVNGQVYVTTDNGLYINRKLFEQDAVERNKNIGLRNVVIMNIIELCKTDFERYIL